MSALTVAALRQRAETALVSSGTFNRSPLPWDMFGRDPSGLMHRGFAVGTPASAWTQNGRQKPSVGGLVETTLSVRLAYKLRLKDQLQSYDDALADELALIQAVVGMARTDITGLVYVDTPRRVVMDEGEWMLTDINFAAQHLIALE